MTLNFDDLMLETLNVHPDVKSLHRVDNADMVGVYFVEVDEGAEAAVQAAIKTRVHADLSVFFVHPGDEEGAKELWRRPEGVRKAKPRSRKKEPQTPTLDELVESLRETLLAERNRCIVEDGAVGETLAGYVFDVSDPCCPPKFLQMVGGDAFVKHCAASGKLPLAVGVMPKNIIAKHVEPIARRVEKMPESPIIFADAPVPKTLSLIMNWRFSNEMVIVTAYKRALGLKAIVVPTVVTLAQ